jgi:flagellar hook-associated protein 2
VDLQRPAATAPGIGGAMAALKTSETSSSGGLAALKFRLEREQKDIDADRTRVDAREAAYKARLLKNMSGMDGRVANLRATQSYLQQQIDQWNKN